MKKSRIFRNCKPSAKVLTAAALTGLIGFGTPAMADYIIQKSPDTPTLDSVKIPVYKEVIGTITVIDTPQGSVYFSTNSDAEINSMLSSGDQYMLNNSSAALQRVLIITDNDDNPLATIGFAADNNNNSILFDALGIKLDNSIPQETVTLEQMGISSIDELNKEIGESLLKPLSSDTVANIEKYYQEFDPILRYDKADGFNSGYTLTKVDKKDTNTITKYILDKETLQVTPVNYRVDLKKTVYGEGEKSKYFTWDDNRKLIEVDSPNSDKLTIEVKYNDELLKNYDV